MNAGVVAWGLAQSPLDLFVSVITLGEIRKGIELRFPDPRRAEIENWLTHVIPVQFRGRILPVDEAVAEQWGRLAAQGKRIGRELPVADGLLIATAMMHGMTLVTRNERDCAGRGVPIFNPWTS